MESSWTKLLERLRAARERLDDPKQLAAFADALSGHLGEIVFYDDPSTPKQSLVHYTSWKRTLAILEARDEPSLRMYNYEHANDPQEGKLWRFVFHELKDKAKWLDKYLPEHEIELLKSGRSTGSTFGLSFSSGTSEVEDSSDTSEVEDSGISGVEDNLTFWRLYGNDGEGCSFKVTGRPSSRIYKVRYLNEDGINVNANEKNEDGSTEGTDEKIDWRVASHLDELLANSQVLVERAGGDIAMNIATGIRRIFGGYHHLAKSAYFEDEREWRMIEVAPKAEVQYDVDERGVVKRYIKGPLLKDVLISNSSITIGPRVPNSGAARAYVEYLLRKRKILLPDVKLSRQAYGSDV